MQIHVLTPRVPKLAKLSQGCSGWAAVLQPLEPAIPSPLCELLFRWRISCALGLACLPALLPTCCWITESVQEAQMPPPYILQAMLRMHAGGQMPSPYASQAMLGMHAGGSDAISLCFTTNDTLLAFRHMQEVEASWAHMNNMHAVITSSCCVAARRCASLCCCCCC